MIGFWLPWVFKIAQDLQKKPRNALNVKLKKFQPENDLNLLGTSPSMGMMMMSMGQSLQPGEVVKNSGKFSKPTKIPGKNYSKDEIIIRNADSGKGEFSGGSKNLHRFLLLIPSAQTTQWWVSKDAACTLSKRWAIASFHSNVVKFLWILI